MKNPFNLYFLLLLCLSSTIGAATYHVKANAEPGGNGSSGNPFSSINEAASIAQPGDQVLIHEGIYRELVDPKNGGTAQERIEYLAAPGENPIIKGSEVITGWSQVEGNVYEVTLTEAFFEGYNPFSIPLATEEDKQTLGQVFIDGELLKEASSMSNVSNKSKTWKASENGLNIRVNFGEINPSEALVEIAVREQVFAPSTYNLGYITLKGLTIEHSANQYPDLFFLTRGHSQKGALSTTGGHDWIIEECIIRHAKTVGLDFGYQGINALLEHGYGAVKEDTLNKAVDRVGRHIIRNNKILNAGSTGMMGMWAPFSLIEGNLVKGSNHLNMGRFEHSAIKTHYFMHGIIRNNFIIDNNTYGIWLDNNYQGVKVVNNVFVNNERSVWTEMGHGPLLIANNIIIDSKPFHSDCAGVVMANNLFYKSNKPEFKSYNIRNVVVWEPNTETRAQPERIRADLERIFYWNNFMIDTDMKSSGETKGGDYNLFADGGQKSSSSHDENSLSTSTSTDFQYEITDSTFTVSFKVDSSPWDLNAPALWPDYVGPDEITGEKIDSLKTDITGHPMPENTWLPGPFQNLVEGENQFVIKRMAEDSIPVGIRERLVPGNQMNRQQMEGSQLNRFDSQGRSWTGVDSKFPGRIFFR